MAFFNWQSADTGILAAALSPTTLFTPDTPGLFVVGVYIEVTTGSGTATVTANIVHTNDVGTKTLPITTALSLTTTGNVIMSGALIRAVAASPIQYSTTIGGIIGLARYRMFVTATQVF
jgi:hypothetical protein